VYGSGLLFPEQDYDEESESSATEEDVPKTAFRTPFELYINLRC
jgi:hypothetical protein